MAGTIAVEHRALPPPRPTLRWGPSAVVREGRGEVLLGAAQAASLLSQYVTPADPCSS